MSGYRSWICHVKETDVPRSVRARTSQEATQIMAENGLTVVSLQQDVEPEDEYGTWFANVTTFGTSDPANMDVKVFCTEVEAIRETNLFGGRVIEVRTHTMAPLGVDEWRRNIASRVRNVVECDPNHMGPIDLRVSP